MEPLARPAPPIPDVSPQHRNYLVCCDESGMDGSVYYGFGSLWMPWDRRGDFASLFTTLQNAYNYHHEIKWKKVHRFSFGMAQALVTEFFQRRWLMFHCLIVRKGYVDLSQHHSFDEARRKHFALLLQTKISFFAARDKRYHAWVDPIHSSYKKAGEAAHKIINSTLKQRIQLPALQSLQERDSRDTPGIQLADLLLGAVMAAWHKEATAAPKIRMLEHVAKHLGWPDLRADTFLKEWKFNIWNFHDPTRREPREIKTRPVQLLFPMPPYRSR